MSGAAPCLEPQFLIIPGPGFSRRLAVKLCQGFTRHLLCRWLWGDSTRHRGAGVGGQLLTCYRKKAAFLRGSLETGWAAARRGKGGTQPTWPRGSPAAPPPPGNRHLIQMLSRSLFLEFTAGKLEPGPFPKRIKMHFLEMSLRP